MNNFIPIFKKNEDKEFNKLVEETAKYVLEIRVYGEYLLNLLRKEKKLNMTVIAFIVEFLKKLDNVSGLIKNHSFNSIMSTHREMFELKVQILYLLEKKKEIKNRTLDYEYFRYYRKYNDAKKIVKTISNVKKKESLSIKEEVYLKLNEQNQSSKQQLAFNLERMKNERFSRTHKIVEKKKMEMKKKNKNKDYFMKWYEVGSKKPNIGQLCYYLGIRDFYDLIYSPCSLDTHGSLSIDNNIHFSDKESPYLKNPNEPNKEIIKNIIIPVNNEADDVYKKIIEIFLFEPDWNRYCEWQMSHSSNSAREELGHESKKSKLLKQWQTFFNRY